MDRSFALWVLAALLRVHKGNEIVFPTLDHQSCSYQGLPGNCIVAADCPGVMHNFRTYGIRPVTCGFIQDLTYVCCPQSEAIRSHNLPTPDAVKTVSPPDVYFDCGRRTVFISSSGFLVRRRRQELSRMRKSTFGPTVVGGEQSEPYSWPWMTLMGTRHGSSNITWLCGGSLINLEWVLTAAHCLLRNAKQSDLVVRLREHNILLASERFQPVDFSVLSVVFHPEFKPRTGYHDIVLLKLSGRAPSELTPVCLPWGDVALKDVVGRNAIVTGWGAEKYGGEGSAYLQEVTLKVINATSCDAAYRGTALHRREFPEGILATLNVCAGHTEGMKDSCQGDSGGPLVVRHEHQYHLLGIVSKGYGCGNALYPGIYVNINHAPYLQWIKEVAF